MDDRQCESVPSSIPFDRINFHKFSGSTSKSSLFPTNPVDSSSRSFSLIKFRSCQPPQLELFNEDANTFLGIRGNSDVISFSQYRSLDVFGVLKDSDQRYPHFPELRLSTVNRVNRSKELHLERDHI